MHHSRAFLEHRIPWQEPTGNNVRLVGPVLDKGDGHDGHALRQSRKPLPGALDASLGRGGCLDGRGWSGVERCVPGSDPRRLAPSSSVALALTGSGVRDE